MRWEQLFEDLGSQADAEAAVELGGEVADRTRREAGRLRLVDRLRPALGARVLARTLGGVVVTGVVAEVGAGWFVLDEDAGSSVLVLVPAVLALSGVGGRTDLPGAEGQVAARLEARHALRELVRDRAPVEVVLVDGTRLTGTLDRVAADHVDLAQHPADQPRRASAVQQVLLLPLAGLAVVRRLG